jgi:hypothetical protein
MARSVCKWTTSVCFFVNKRTNDKLPFARWANGKRIKENCLGFRFRIDVYIFRFPFETAAYMYIHLENGIHIYGKWNILLYIRKTVLTENGSFCSFAAKEKRKWPNFRLFAAHGNRKWNFIFLVLQTKNLINDCPSVILWQLWVCTLCQFQGLQLRIGRIHQAQNTTTTALCWSNSLSSLVPNFKH